jgi:hypothetical protein
MTADTGTSAAFPRVLGDLLQDAPDEFDLDIRWGELDHAGSWTSYLPTAREFPPGETTCDTNAATCPDTCHATCPATCAATCPDTCHATCQDTCHRTCPDTCGRTCAEIDSCGGTCAQTHCFTCRGGCVPP